MQRLEVLNEEEHRLDKIIIRAYGTYSWSKVAVIKFFNPTLDLLWVLPGMKILIPNEQEIKDMGNFRAFYDLVRN